MLKPVADLPAVPLPTAGAGTAAAQTENDLILPTTTGGGGGGLHRLSGGADITPLWIPGLVLDRDLRRPG